MSTAFRIFDPSTLRKFESLALVANQVRSGSMKGERRSTKRGTSVEFADYRDYVKGDDLRRVDWNIYARFDRPYIKLHEEEEDLAVHFLIDSSASMDWPRQGDKDQHKFVWSLRVLGALAYLSLMTGDLVQIHALRPDRAVRWGPYRGRGYAMNMLQHLEKLGTRGEVNLNVALRDYAMRSRRPGLAIIISDMMTTDYRDGLSAMQSRGFELVLIQALAPDEVNPEITGDLRLIDVESGIPQEVTIDAEMRDLYQQRLLAWQEEIGDFCLKRGIHYVTAQTSAPWEELILFGLRRIGVVR